MKALVTGASGFVGPHLVAHLEAAGDRVVAVDRGGATPVDVTDRDAVQAVMRDVRPAAVYHLAALSHVAESWSAAANSFRVNAEGTLNVLVAARDAGVGRVLVVGSAEEYGAVREADLPIDEDAPLRPMTPYGASKVAADYLALQAYLGAGLETVRARPFNHTGPGQSPRFLVPALARRVAEAERAGEDKVLVGSLDPVRDITDVRDVVRAYRSLVERGEPGEVYNVCSGRGTTVREIAERLLAHAHRKLELVVDENLVRKVEVPRLVGNPSKIGTAIGWSPEIDIDRTLDDVLAAGRAGDSRRVDPA